MRDLDERREKRLTALRWWVVKRSGWLEEEMEESWNGNDGDAAGWNETLAAGSCSGQPTLRQLASVSTEGSHL